MLHSLQPRAFLMQLRYLGSSVILSVHGQHRLPIAESNHEMAAFARFERAALTFQPRFSSALVMVEHTYLLRWSNAPTMYEINLPPARLSLL